jgi:hypothetical protein
LHSYEISVPSVELMPWPPRTGEPLPRTGGIWFEQSKLEWILGAEGHGQEWARVFHVDSRDWERVWGAIAEATPGATIKEVRKRSPHGITCGIQIDLMIGDRSARALISWHYATKIAMPRLVTAYPTP